MVLPTLNSLHLADPVSKHPPLGVREVRVYAMATGDRDTVRTASREILATLLGMTPGELMFDYTEQGKPLLRDYPGLYYSTSHAESASLIAVTNRAAVGVDIEKIRAVPNADVILRRFFSSQDRDVVLATPDGQDERFMQAWTRAEASVKVRGGSVWEMATVDPAVTVRNIETVDGYAAAVAVADNDWELTRYDY